MNDHMPFDVCLIYEHYGDFQGNNIKPWVESLIQSMPMIRFAVVALHSGQLPTERLPEEPHTAMDYHCITIDIRNSWQIPSSAQRKHGENALPAAPELLRALFRGKAKNISDAMEKLQHQLEVSPRGTHNDLLNSEANWHMLRESYQENANGGPFQSYFELSRALLAPLYAFSEQVEALPVARCYHTLTHGYAGYLGTLLQRRYESRLISSNLGSQTLPKRSTADAAYAGKLGTNALGHTELWLRLREAMKRVTNNHATAITTTSQHQYEQRHLELDKATPIHLIPEGIDTEYFYHLFAQHSEGPPLVVASIGAITPSHDTKGFIRAVASLRERIPQVMGWVVGSMDLDPQYAKECKSLVRNLGLYNHLRFFGDQDESTIYPRIGVLVVNTLADTPPVTLQQAQAAGVPVVATNVGACKERIEGRDEQDKMMGLSGAIVPFANPTATAAAVADLLENPANWSRIRLTAVERCKRYYALDSMLQQYRNLYKNAVRAA